MYNNAINNIIKFYKSNNQKISPELMKDIINISVFFDGSLNTYNKVKKIFSYGDEVIHALSNLKDKIELNLSSLITILENLNPNEVSKEELIFFLNMCQKYAPEGETKWDYSLEMTSFLPIILNAPNFYELTEFVASHPCYLDIVIFKNIIRVLKYDQSCDQMKILTEIDEIQDIKEKFTTAGTILDEKSQDALIVNANNSLDILEKINMENKTAKIDINYYTERCERYKEKYNRILSRKREIK